ncbi:MAG: hypothetical protein NXY59_06435 [Aigarchaeota archaeon]|nr:hypothetical protein [Candidatus Pelearchaeum maunauluense]
MNKIDRREFVKLGAVLGACAIVGTQIASALNKFEEISLGAIDKERYGANPLAKPESIIYSVCLQCHTAYPIKSKTLDGVLVKIEGNPYSPQNLLPHLRYDTSPEQAAKIDGVICPKGHAGIETLYDPYRIRRALKRAGPRGSNKWKVITFEQAIQEIVEGGYLFKDIPGEEDRYVPGSKELWIWGLIREKGGDPSTISAGINADIKAINSTPLNERKNVIDEFKRKWSSRFGELGLKLEGIFIDPDHPDLGTKANQLVFMPGRIEHGRKEFSKRWLIDSFGSVNWYEHTTICEQSHHIAYKMISGRII